MQESDWSEFIPNLVIAIISILLTLLFSATIAYLKSEKFKKWFNRLPTAMGIGGKWLINKWYFVLPLCIVILLITVAFRFYGDWKLVTFSFVSYVVGLLTWVLFNTHRKLIEKEHATSTIMPKFLSIPIPAGFGNTYLKNRYITPPVGDVF